MTENTILIPTTISISPQVVIIDNEVIPMSIMVKYENVQVRNKLDLLDQLPECVKELPLDYYCYDMCHEHTLLYVPLHKMLPPDVVDAICNENDSACIRLHNTMIAVARMEYARKKSKIVGIQVEPTLEVL